MEQQQFETLQARIQQMERRLQKTERRQTAILVRQVLRHESLAMALRYAHLTKPDVSAKFRRASPLDNLRAGGGARHKDGPCFAASMA